MNTKVLLAFIGGLMIASGVTYVAMKRSAPPALAAPQSPAPPATQPVVTPAPKPAPVAAETAEPAPPEPAPVASAPASERPVRRASKPSPVTRVTRPILHASLPAPVEAPPPQPTTVAASMPPSNPSPAPLPVSEPVAPPPAPEPVRIASPPPPEPHTVTIPAGTTLSVRLGETISTDRSRPGDEFHGTLDQPLIEDGFVIAERGSRVSGRIVEAEPGGRVKGTASIALELTQVNTADGQRVKVSTGAFRRQADSSRSRDAAKVGIGAAIGAAIGGMAGGGKGAAVGAGVGSAAGAGDVLLTRGKAVEIPVETRISFRLSEPVTITEKLR